MTWQQY